MASSVLWCGFSWRCGLGFLWTWFFWLWWGFRALPSWATSATGQGGKGKSIIDKSAMRSIHRSVDRFAWKPRRERRSQPIGGFPWKSAPCGGSRFRQINRFLRANCAHVRFLRESASRRDVLMGVPGFEWHVARFRCSFEPDGFFGKWRIPFEMGEAIREEWLRVCLSTSRGLRSQWHVNYMNQSWCCNMMIIIQVHAERGCDQRRRNHYLGGKKRAKDGMPARSWKWVRGENRDNAQRRHQDGLAKFLTGKWFWHWESKCVPQIKRRYNS